MWPFKKKPAAPVYVPKKKYKYRIVEFNVNEYRIEWATYTEPNWWANMPLPITYNSIVAAQAAIERQMKKDSFVPRVIAEYA